MYERYLPMFRIWIRPDFHVQIFFLRCSCILHISSEILRNCVQSIWCGKWATNLAVEALRTDVEDAQKSMRKQLKCPYLNKSCGMTCINAKYVKILLNNIGTRCNMQNIATNADCCAWTGELLHMETLAGTLIQSSKILHTDPEAEI